MSRITEVSLVGNLKILTESKSDQKVEVIGLSSAGAYIRSLTSQTVGEPILLSLKTDEPVEIKGEIKRKSRSKDSQSVFYVAFDELNKIQYRAIEQITNYYLKLKKAGVQLEAPIEEGPTIP